MPGELKEFPPVPLVGAPFSIDSWSASVAGACQCGQKLMLVRTTSGAAPVRCPACKRAYILGDGTKLHAEVAIVLMPPPAGSV